MASIYLGGAAAVYFLGPTLLGVAVNVAGKTIYYGIKGMYRGTKYLLSAKSVNSTEEYDEHDLDTESCTRNGWVLLDEKNYKSSKYNEF